MNEKELDILAEEMANEITCMDKYPDDNKSIDYFIERLKTAIYLKALDK